DSYLFGTMHNQDHNYTIEEVFETFHGLRDAIGQVDVVFNETRNDFEDSTCMEECANAAKLFVEAAKLTDRNRMVSSVSYKDLFESEKQYEVIDSFLRKYTETDYTVCLPAFWTHRLKVFPTNEKIIPSKTVDICIYEYSKGLGKECLPLETLVEQATAILYPFSDTLEYRKPLNEQARNLYKRIVEIKSDTLDLSCLTDKYKENRLDELQEYLGKSSNWNLTESKLSVQIGRNKNWLPKIIDTMARKSTLVAVGNWHLSGMQGLIALLREKGYEVTPIE
ncbi:MAG: TraB/GumN family protein, partial [Prevotella sp.]|nr:TraB/GumN family protein [Prevotella sp.]